MWMGDGDEELDREHSDQSPTAMRAMRCVSHRIGTHTDSRLHILSYLPDHCGTAP